MKPFTLLALVLLPALAHAETLQNDMKAIGKLFKGISQTASDSSKNTANAAAADQLIKLFNDVLNQVPDAISKLPAPSQAAAIADYKRLIGLEIAAATELKADFLAGNNSAAAGVIASMNNDKREGHGKFNPDN